LFAREGTLFVSSAGVVDLLGFLKFRGTPVGELDRGVVALRSSSCDRRPTL
jgi:hypothetical protein